MKKYNIDREGFDKTKPHLIESIINFLCARKVLDLTLGFSLLNLSLSILSGHYYFNFSISILNIIHFSIGSADYFPSDWFSLWVSRNWNKYGDRNIDFHFRFPKTVVVLQLGWNNTLTLRSDWLIARFSGSKLNSLRNVFKTLDIPEPKNSYDLSKVTSKHIDDIYNVIYKRKVSNDLVTNKAK